MSGGKVVAWLDEIGGSWETEGQASRFSDGPPRALVLQSDLAAAIARAEAAEADARRLDFIAGIWSKGLTPQLAAVVEALRAGDSETIRATIDAAIAAQQAEGE